MSSPQKEQKQRELAAALSKLDRLNKQEAFDPHSPESRPTPGQQEVIKDFGKFPIQVIKAGNQSGKCLVAGTLVATPTGPIPIEQLAPGDTVYSEHGTPIKVLNVMDQGIQEVADITHKGRVWASCTANHRWGVISPKGILYDREAQHRRRDEQIRRTYVKASLGNVRELHAYAIGALLGDGCSKQRSTTIQLSSATEMVPAKVVGILTSNSEYAMPRKMHRNNYTWDTTVHITQCNHYEAWANDRYAHEKLANLDMIKTWDRESLISFVAGLIDTDGSLYSSKHTLRLSLTMQAKSVVDAFSYACLALWQVNTCMHTDSRDRYKNGPVYEAYVTNPLELRRIYQELDSHLVSPQKKWRSEYNNLLGKRTSSQGTGFHWGDNPRLEQTYDIEVDSPTHLFLLANGLVTHNSATCARIISWVLTNTNPHGWTKPVSWLDEPLLCIVAGKTGKIIEESLWPKVRSFLEPGSYKEVRLGNILQRVELDNGSRIVFQSLENPTVAQQRLQSYVAHLVWIDELPPTMGIIRELLIRVQARQGFLLMSFTPTMVNLEIQRYVDSLMEPEGKIYKFHMLDNPLYSEAKRRNELLARYSTLPEHVQRAIFEGEWMSSDDQVYYFNYERMVGMPEGYSRVSWRHVEAVDPALKSALGLTVWAENPVTGVWYCVLAEYVKGIYVPTDLVKAVREKVRHFNIVRRVADPHEVWYIQTAASMGITYMGVYKKNERKAELIKNLQEALGTKMMLTPDAGDLIAELQQCRWSDRGEGKIVNASSYHLLDSAQYARDNLPRPEHKPTASHWQEALYQANEKRKADEDKAKKKLERKHGGKIQIQRKRGLRW